MKQKYRTLTFEGAEAQRFDTEEEARAAAEVAAKEAGHPIVIEQYYGDTHEWSMMGYAGEGWPAWDAEQEIVLGDWVRSVYKVHPGFPGGFGCPENNRWLRGQSIPVMHYKYRRWVSILVHEGGSVVVPSELCKRLDDHPARLDNRYTNQYFRD
jgi:hypothetical protein